MKLVYFGTAEFAVPALRRLAPQVILVVSQPDRPSGRGMRTQASPVKLAAIELGLPVETPEKARDPAFVERVKALEADALVVTAYGQILSQAMLDSARRGAFNLHGSILPKYRGAAPIQRAILDGEEETGVTLMQMDKGMDTGEMIALLRTEIEPDETAGELGERLSEMAADVVGDWIEAIVSGDYPHVPQPSELATYAPKVEKAEAELKFDMGALEAYRRFRAFTPSPGAFLRTRFGTIRLRSVRLGTAEGRPGTLLTPDEVGFGDGSLRLLEVQPEGKRPMTLRDFANGVRLRVGESLAHDDA